VELPKAHFLNGAEVIRQFVVDHNAGILSVLNWLGIIGFVLLAAYHFRWWPFGGDDA
jgi:hypothetical protein